METAGNNHDASRQPDGMQAINTDREHVERALNHIHVARAALDAAEDHLGKADPGRADAYRLAAAISLSITESHCISASETLAKISDKYKVRGAHRTTYQQPASGSAVH